MNDNRNFSRRLIQVSVVVLFIFLSLYFFHFLAAADSDRVTHLKLYLLKVPAVKKSAVLNNIAKEIRWQETTNGETGNEILGYSEKALALALKFKNKEQEINALANRGFGYWKVGNKDNAFEFARRGLVEAERLGKKESIIYALEVLAIFNEYIPDYKKALEIYHRMISLCEEMGDKIKLARFTHSVGGIYYASGEIDKAFICFKKALSLYKQIGDQRRTAQMLVYIGSLNSHFGNDEKAVEYFFRAAEFAGNAGIDDMLGRAYDAVARLYKKQKNYIKSLEYYKKALKIFKKINHTAWLRNINWGLGDLYKIDGKYDTALIYYGESIKYHIEKYNSGKNGMAKILILMGQVFFEKKEYDKALIYYKQALEIALKHKELRYQIDSYKGIGEVYVEKGDFEKSLFHLEKSLTVARKTQSNASTQDIYKALAGLYDRTEHYKKALEYFRLYSNMKDRTYTEASAKEIAVLQTRYETEKKIKEIEVLKKNNEIQDLKLSRATIIRNGLIAGFTLVSIILALLFKKYLYLFAFWKKEKYIGQYRLMDKVGSGAMGTVFRAQSIIDKTEIAAVKILREEFFSDESTKKRFKQEAIIIDKLEHPNIIKIIERGEYKEQLFIAMEYLQGSTLESRMNVGGKLSLGESIHIMTQVVDALVFIHGKSIIHRDLKPANIMLIEKDGDPDFVKLLDFGLAKMEFQTRLTQSGNFVGTIEYVAPEQILDAVSSLANDIFALGIMFYKMLCGQSPFPGDTVVGIMRQVVNKKPVKISKFRPDVPKALNDLIMKMIAKKPEKRPSAQTILSELHHSLHS